MQIHLIENDCQFQQLLGSIDFQLPHDAYALRKLKPHIYYKYMPDFRPRQFKSADEITEIAVGFLNKTLPKQLWTHEAHFAALVYLYRHRPQMKLSQDLPRLIYDYNIATGGENTDTSGYHETLTQFYIKIVGDYIKKIPDWDILTSVNHLVASEEARREYPLYFYSKELLFSVKARKEWVEPDLQELATT